MTRTEDLKGKGAIPISSGGSDAPFLKWPEKGGKRYGYIEGKVLSMWEGKYGPVLVMTAEHGEAVRAEMTPEEGMDPEPVKIEPGMVLNVGMSSTVLRGFVPNIQIGHEYHIAFNGWEKSKSGNTYRVFEVLDLNAPPEEESSYENPPDVEETEDDLPF